MKNLAQVTKIGNQINGAVQSIQKQGATIEASIKQFNDLLIVLQGGNRTTEVKRKPGRPKKDTTANKATVTVTKRKPGRPKKAESQENKQTVMVKRKPGRPKKAESQENKQIVVVKRGPGRPKKQIEVPVAVAGSAESKRGRGRPKLSDKGNSATVTKLPTSEINADLSRVVDNVDRYNKWWSDSTKDKEVAKIENGSYFGIVEGFYSSGNSGRYGITTRVYVNPNSKLVPEDLKNHINTTAVNRIRYVGSKEEGLTYIEKQKAKLKEDFFAEILPQIIKDHGKPDSVYAFHLNSDIRKKFNKLKVAYNETQAGQTSKNKTKVSIG